MAQVTINDFTTTVAPRWAGEGKGRHTLMPGGGKLDAAQFNAEDAVVVVVGAAGAAQNATSVPVGALSGPIPNGTTLSFGTNKYATLTAAAASGATSLTVRAIPTALVQDDTATYPGLKKKLVVNGTLVGRTFTERDSGTNYGPAVSTDDELFIVADDVTDATQNPNCSLYQNGKVVKENFLPGWTSLSSAMKAAVRAKYKTMKGAN